MRFENDFAVAGNADEVFKALLDVERVAPCLPGVRVLEQTHDEAYKVEFKVKVGPIAMTYRGELRITGHDDAAREATMHAKASESRGQGTADANIRMSLVEEAGATRAHLDTDVQLSGKVAAMGQGVIGDVSAKLIETFAENLQAMLGPIPQAAGAVSSAPAAPGATVTYTIADAALAGPRRPAATLPHSSLPVGRIAAGVIAGRLGNPRTLVLVSFTFAVIFMAIGFGLGRIT